MTTIDELTAGIRQYAQEQLDAASAVANATIADLRTQLGTAQEALSTANAANAAIVADLNAQIVSLKAQIVALTPVVVTPPPVVVTPPPVVVPPVAGQVLPGWLRTAANTGLSLVGTTAAMLTTVRATANITLTTPAYRKRYIMGGFQLILGTGGVLEECEITSSRNAGQGCIRLIGKNQKILNCDLIVTASTSGESLGVFSDTLDGVVIRSLRQTGTSIGMWLDGPNNAAPSLVDQWYLSNQQLGQAHHDGFTRRSSAGPLTLSNSRISMGNDYVTSAVFLQNTWGPVGGVTITGNLLEGTGFNLELDGTISAVVTNNRLAKSGWGEVTINQRIPSFTWSENYKYLAAGVDGKGALIENPNP